MKLIRRLEDFPKDLRGGALTIGNFDGVHQGHRHIIGELCSMADKAGGPAVVFTFDPHPAFLLRPREAPPPLTWIDRKAKLLSELGVDVVLACHTTEELLELSWQNFFDQVIRDTIGAAAIVEGRNFRFGNNREGDVELLVARCAENGMNFRMIDVIQQMDETVSSSRIRELIKKGEVSEAGKLLTQPYRIRGLVVHGAARGAKLGFPTANLNGIDTLIPAVGVYAGIARIGGRPHGAAIHVGPNPTFGEGAVKVEVHVLDHDESLYGQLMETDFLRRLRDIKHFASAAELTAQLKDDVSAARSAWREWAVAHG